MPCHHAYDVIYKTFHEYKDRGRGLMVEVEILIHFYISDNSSKSKLNPPVPTITMKLSLTILLAALAALSTAAPGRPLLRRDEDSVPDEIVAPPPGLCALLVYSTVVLPIGGEPTSESGDGIGPSEGGEQEVGVINHFKDIVGTFVPFKNDAGDFQASLQLDPNRINDAGVVTAAARYSFFPSLVFPVLTRTSFIMQGEDSWGVNYQYKGVNQDISNCQRYTIGSLSKMDIQQFNFAC